MANDITIDIGARNKASAVMFKVGSDATRLGQKIAAVGVQSKASLVSVASGFRAVSVAAAASRAAVAGAAAAMSASMGALKIATAGAGIAGIASVKAFASFDAGMASVAAITQSTGKELDSLREKAKELGSTTQFSATQAAEGMKFLGMAGFDTQQILAGIGPTLSLAAAGSLELGMAADIASDVSSAFGLTADEIARVADVLATTATSANTTVEMMGETFQFAAPVAKAAGQSIEEVSIAAGILGNAGIKASSAGTDLKNVMVAIAKEDSASKIRDLGVELVNAEGEMRPLLEIMADFGRATERLTGPQRLATAIDIFGKISGKSALILSDAGDSVDKLRAKMDQAPGSANRMAKVMQDSLGGVGVRIKSAMEGMAISMVEGLEKPLNEIGGMVVDKLSGATEWFDKNSDSVLQFGEDMKGVFTGGISIINDMKTALSWIPPIFGWIAEELRKVDMQLAKVGAASLGIKLAKWWKGQDFVKTIGGGDSQEMAIFKEVVSGLEERLSKEKEITAEKTRQREIDSAPQPDARQASPQRSPIMTKQDAAAEIVAFSNESLSADRAKSWDEIISKASKFRDEMTKPITPTVNLPESHAIELTVEPQRTMSEIIGRERIDDYGFSRRMSTMSSTLDQLGKDLDFQFAKTIESRSAEAVAEIQKANQAVIASTSDREGVGFAYKFVSIDNERLKIERQITSERESQLKAAEAGMRVFEEIAASQSKVISIADKLATSRGRQYDVQTSVRGQRDELFAKESRLKTGRGESRRNLVESRIERLEHVTEKGLGDVVKAVTDSATAIIESQPDFEKASVEVIEQ